jgi:hypothetical protein
MASEKDPIQLKQVKKYQNLEPHGIEIAQKWEGVANNINLKGIIVKRITRKHLISRMFRFKTMKARRMFFLPPIFATSSNRQNWSKSKNTNVICPSFASQTNMAANSSNPIAIIKVSDKCPDFIPYKRNLNSASIFSNYYL